MASAIDKWTDKHPAATTAIVSLAALVTGLTVVYFI